MRVISGIAKGKKLKRVHGHTTRPIGDRVKESLFNILGWEVEGAIFLDLFAGTGSVGIEALSRGASSATFIENNPLALRTIQENLDHTNFLKIATVIKMDVFKYLAGQANEAFDFVYIAPPQYRELWSKTLEQLDHRIDWLNPDAWVITQIDPKEHTQSEYVNLVHFDRRRYGQTQLDFYEFPGS